MLGGGAEAFKPKRGIKKTSFPLVQQVDKLLNDTLASDFIELYRPGIGEEQCKTVARPQLGLYCRSVRAYDPVQPFVERMRRRADLFRNYRGLS